MKPQYFLHFLAFITLLLGVYIFIGDSERVAQDETVQQETRKVFSSPGQQTQGSFQSTAPEQLSIAEPDISALSSKTSDNKIQTSSEAGNETNVGAIDLDPIAIRDQYIAAWNNRDQAQLEKLWTIISKCEPCLQEFVELIVAKKIEKGMLLGVAAKMAALDTNIVLPVFDALIVPDGDKSMAIILSEKLILNGRPEFVEKIFDVIYRAKESGYDNFSHQLTWVISKLENAEGIQPILDTITGRQQTSPEFSTHVTKVYSKVVPTLPETSKAATIIADYYVQANSAEQQKLWPVVSQHGATLVKLAVSADQNGQNYQVQKFAQAMTELPHLNAVDSLVRLHTSVEYSPAYMKGMLQNRVADNPTIKVLHKLEDYMRNPTVKLESRIFAAEGLLAVRQNRQARYILEKVLNNTQAPDVELQAYIGGRL